VGTCECFVAFYLLCLSQLQAWLVCSAGASDVLSCPCAICHAPAGGSILGFWRLWAWQVWRRSLCRRDAAGLEFQPCNFGHELIDAGLRLLIVLPVLLQGHVLSQLV
jgi:hypothetical protein